MRDIVRAGAASLGISVLAAMVAVTSGTDAFAQAKQQQMAPPPKQAPAQAAPAQRKRRSQAAALRA